MQGSDAGREVQDADVLTKLAAMPDWRASIGPRRHRTLFMHNHVWVGADRRVESARVTQVIEATADGLDSIPLASGTGGIQVVIGQGCSGLGNVSHVAAGIHATAILLDRTLRRGETATLEYWLSFRRLTDPGCEYEIGRTCHLSRIGMWVEFDPDTLPGRVWWASWDGNGRLLRRETVSLDTRHSVHRDLHSTQATVLGYYWEWETDSHPR